MSLMNTIIDRALERQRKFLIDHIDSKLDTVTRPVPATVEEFDFRQEGNTIQHKFNSQCSDKLSEVLRLIQFGHNEDTADVVSRRSAKFGNATNLSRLPTVTDGIRYGSILYILWLTTMRTPVSCVQPSQELLVRGTFPSHTTGNLQLNLTKDMVDSPVVKALFFVQKSNQKTIQPQYLHQVHVFSATCPETLQSIAYTTAASSQQGPQTTATTATSSANAGQPPSNNVVTNEVECFNCSDYVLKQGSYVVKGNLRKHLQFWKNILCVTQYIAEIIEFGFKIPFIKVPSQIFGRNNLSTNFVENAIHELTVY
jgi:hypothetical protein